MRFSLLFFSLLLGCNTNYMVGPQTINKVEAEKDIRKVILLKTLTCGYNIARASAISKLGNDEKQGGDFLKFRIKLFNRDSEGVTYDRNAVRNCLRAISVMPCQNSKTETAIGDNEFVATLIFTRYQSCNFRATEFWEINEPIKGRL